MNGLESVPWHLSEDGRRAEWTWEDIELEQLGLTLDREESRAVCRGLWFGCLLGLVGWVLVAGLVALLVSVL